MSAPTPLRFLVIDDNADSRFLLVKTLLRKFPSATVRECQNAETAINLATEEAPAAIVTHRTTEMGGLELLGLLRRANPKVPIVMVSSIDRAAEAREQGADQFLLYDEWLRIGTVIFDLIARARRESDNDNSPELQTPEPV